MGWWIEGADDHEGYLAHLGSAGRQADSYGQHMNFRRPDDSRASAAWERGETPTNDDIYEQVPWSELSGWRTQCECGWRGTTWTRTDLGLEGADDGSTLFNPNLPDGRALEDIAAQEWERHVLPLAQLEELRTAASDLRAAHDALDAAVAAARAGSPPATWEQIGRAVGMTRQSAHDRWATRAQPVGDST